MTGSELREIFWVWLAAYSPLLIYLLYVFLGVAVTVIALNWKRHKAARVFALSLALVLILGGVLIRSRLGLYSALGAKCLYWRHQEAFDTVAQVVMGQEDFSRYHAQRKELWPPEIAAELSELTEGWDIHHSVPEVLKTTVVEAPTVTVSIASERRGSEGNYTYYYQHLAYIPEGGDLPLSFVWEEVHCQVIHLTGDWYLYTEIRN